MLFQLYQISNILIDFLKLRLLFLCQRICNCCSLHIFYIFIATYNLKLNLIFCIVFDTSCKNQKFLHMAPLEHRLILVYCKNLFTKIIKTAHNLFQTKCQKHLFSLKQLYFLCFRLSTEVCEGASIPACDQQFCGHIELCYSQHGSPESVSMAERLQTCGTLLWKIFHPSGQSTNRLF